MSMTVRLGDDDRGQPAGRDHQRLALHLLLDPLDEVLDQPDVPSTEAERIAVTVFRPMAARGAFSSTVNSRAARDTSPSRALSMPGAIEQPSSRPSAETASNVVAVPRSTTMAGQPVAASSPPAS